MYLHVIVLYGVAFNSYFTILYCVVFVLYYITGGCGCRGPHRGPTPAIRRTRQPRVIPPSLPPSPLSVARDSLPPRSREGRSCSCHHPPCEGCPRSREGRRTRQPSHAVVHSCRRVSPWQPWSCGCWCGCGGRRWHASIDALVAAAAAGVLRAIGRRRPTPAPRT